MADRTALRGARFYFESPALVDLRYSTDEQILDVRLTGFPKIDVILNRDRGELTWACDAGVRKPLYDAFGWSVTAIYGFKRVNPGLPESGDAEMAHQRPHLNWKPIFSTQCEQKAWKRISYGSMTGFPILSGG